MLEIEGVTLFWVPLQDGVCDGVSTDTCEYQASFQVFLVSCCLCHQMSSSSSSVSKEEASAHKLSPHLEELENLGLSWRVHEWSRQTVVLMGFVSMSWLIQLLGVTRRDSAKKKHISTLLYVLISLIACCGISAVRSDYLVLPIPYLYLPWKKVNLRWINSLPPDCIIFI